MLTGLETARGVAGDNNTSTDIVFRHKGIGNGGRHYDSVLDLCKGHSCIMMDERKDRLTVKHCKYFIRPLRIGAERGLKSDTNAR